MDPQGPHAEAFRHLALRVGGELEAREASSVLVTSALPREGKTLTACNLALALASLASDERIALVDFDLRRPTVAEILDIRVRVGIPEVVRGDAPLEAAVVRTDQALDVLPTARAVPAAHELLARREVADVVKQLEARYRFVVCDAPPCLPVPDVALLLPHVGACLGVTRAGVTPRSVARHVLEILDDRKLIGFFLNEARPPRTSRHYYQSNYYTEPGDREGGPEDIP